MISSLQVNIILYLFIHISRVYMIYIKATTPSSLLLLWFHNRYNHNQPSSGIIDNASLLEAIPHWMDYQSDHHNVNTILSLLHRFVEYIQIDSISAISPTSNRFIFSRTWAISTTTSPLHFLQLTVPFHNKIR